MSIENVSTRLAKSNAAVQQHFDMAAVSLADLISPVDLASWAERCLLITEAGWHSYEATEAYLALSARLAEVSVERLLKVGEFGCILCKYSFEPGKRYFEGYLAHLKSGRADVALQIETLGKRIQDKYANASSLISEYFSTAMWIAENRERRDVDAWLELIQQSVELPRVELSRLINISEASATATAPWHFVLELRENSEVACITYLTHHADLARTCPVDFLQDIQPILLKYINADQPVTAWYEALIGQPFTSPEGRELVHLLEKIDDVRLATCLVNSCSNLPLDNKRVMEAWLQAGLAAAKSRFETAEAFFNLESASSLELLEKLMGQVHFRDCKRVLQLYTEAFCGRRLGLESIDDIQDEADFRELPGTDGRTVFLPELVSIHNDQAQNFAYYKVALLHQLGFFEFGTFQALRESSKAIRQSDQPRLARFVFQVLEDARVDWQLEFKFRGAAKAIREQKAYSLDKRPAVSLYRQSQLLESLIQLSLGGEIPGWIEPGWQQAANSLKPIAERLSAASATVYDSLDLLPQCLELLAGDGDLDEATVDEIPLPPSVPYRGESDNDQVMINLALMELEESLELSEEEDTFALSDAVDPKNAQIVEVRKGNLDDDALGMLMTELDIDLDGAEDVEGDDENSELRRKFNESLRGIAGQGRENQQFRYDEWDYVIEDYRRRWCTLHEIREFDEDIEFVSQTLREQATLVRNVRKQLNMLKPELLRKIKGVPDGEELDLERAVEAIVDRKSGFTPDERIYVHRQRKDRDVAALFLLDMSASTDDVIVEPDKTAQQNDVQEQDDTFLSDFYGDGDVTSPEEGKRIIDLEKESVVLMSEALETLGDSYSVCGFSGYGRDQVDYFVCKDFDEPLNYRTKGRIGGIKPCRSTRMGPAIRHATRSLIKTECRIKTLIIISDGYPQDFDYGKDRNSKEYGIMDTMKALTESKQQGVQSFCLTVDPSGHDYLREMCPDSQYMVIQDIRQLPNELSKVYRSLTG